MNISHIDVGPLLYGFLIFFPILLLAYKIKTGKWFQVAFDLSIMYVLFNMHGASTEGRMSATIATMLCSTLLIYLFPKSWRA